MAKARRSSKGKVPKSKGVQKPELPSPFKKYVGYLKEWTGKDPDELVREMRGE